MFFSALVLVPAATLLIVASAARDIPASWTTCKRNLPPEEYDSCLIKAVTAVVKELITKGEPTLGIQPLDPLKISSLEVSQGNGPVSVNMKFKDMELHNIHSFEITKINHDDLDNYKFGADLLYHKPFVIRSKYTVDGKVLLLPVKGEGDSTLTLDNYRVKMGFVGTPYKKKGETYVNITQFNEDVFTDRLHLKFDNLFEGNKALGDNINAFLNENWDILYNDMKPAILEALSVSFKHIANQVFNKIPYEKIFPPS